MRRRALLLAHALAFNMRDAASQTPQAMSGQLRQLALSTTLESLRLDPSLYQGHAFGAVIDVTRSDGTTMTIACFAEGSTSVYFSSGGGVIGSGSDKAVRDASRELLASVTERLKHLKPDSRSAVPIAGHVAIFGLYADGRRRADEAEPTLAGGASPLSAPYKHARSVLSAVQAAQLAGRQR